MRKIILNVAISLDGFIEGSNGEYDWCFTDQDYGMTEFLNRVDAIFFGRKSFEVLIKSGDINQFGPKTNYVFSKSLPESHEAHIISENVEQEVAKIKQSTGKDIWLFGGAKLTSSLIEMGAVDEMMLAVHPILLGSGKPLFSLDKRLITKLISSKTYDTGLVSLHYLMPTHL
jgi:dihydrofolate reductase